MGAARRAHPRLFPMLCSGWLKVWLQHLLRVRLRSLHLRMPATYKRPAASVVPTVNHKRPRTISDADAAILRQLERNQPSLSHLQPRIELRRAAAGGEDGDEAAATLQAEWRNGERCQLCDSSATVVDPVDRLKARQWASGPTCYYCQKSKSKMTRPWSNNTILRCPHLTYSHGMIREDFIRTLRELSRSEDSVTSVTCFGDVRL